MSKKEVQLEITIKMARNHFLVISYISFRVNRDAPHVPESETDLSFQDGGCIGQ